MASKIAKFVLIGCVALVSRLVAAPRVAGRLQAVCWVRAVGRRWAV